MIKLVCYGVRETEVKYFEEINKKFGYDIKLVTLGLNHENVKEAIGAEAVMVRGNCKADRQNLELLKANGLKYLLTRTVGFDHVDLQAVKDLDLKCARVPGYSPNAIGELALSLSMMLLRHTAYTVNRTREKNFVVDPFMFSKDVNYHMINDEFISKMKDGAILVNTARGEVQDIEAIIRGIESGKLGGFGTDVLEGESVTFFKDLREKELENDLHQRLVDLYPRVLVTPHIGSYTDEALINMIEFSYENLRDFLNEGTCKNSIA